MNKIETVRALNDSKPQLQIVDAVRTLQQTTRQMSDSISTLPETISKETTKALEPLTEISTELKSLPSAIATEAGRALEPLTTIAEDVKKAIVFYDQISAAQRRTLENLTLEQKSQISELLAPISTSAKQIAGMKTAVKEMSQNLNDEISRIEAIGTKIYNTAEANRPRWWKPWLMAVITGVVGALLVLTGQNALNRIMPPSELQQSAAWGQAVWSRATPAEQKLLNQIVSRPAK